MMLKIRKEQMAAFTAALNAVYEDVLVQDLAEHTQATGEVPTQDVLRSHVRALCERARGWNITDRGYLRGLSRWCYDYGLDFEAAPAHERILAILDSPTLADFVKLEMVARRLKKPESGHA